MMKLLDRWYMKNMPIPVARGWDYRLLEEFEKSEELGRILEWVVIEAVKDRKA